MYEQQEIFACSNLQLNNNNLQGLPHFSVAGTMQRKSQLLGVAVGKGQWQMDVF